MNAFEIAEKAFANRTQKKLRPKQQRTTFDLRQFDKHHLRYLFKGATGFESGTLIKVSSLVWDELSDQTLAMIKKFGSQHSLEFEVFEPGRAQPRTFIF